MPAQSKDGVRFFLLIFTVLRLFRDCFAITLIYFGRRLTLIYFGRRIPHQPAFTSGEYSLFMSFRRGLQ